MAESIAASEVVDPDLDIPQLNLPSGIVERAQGGDSFAQLDIGKAYYSATTLQGNCEKAFYWFMLSADLDNMEAQFKLGELYASGQGTKKDETTAYDWYLKSALQGYPKALIRIHDLYHAEENMHCRGQIDDGEKEWTKPDFKAEKGVRELYEYRVLHYKAQMTSIKRYFETLFKQCHEQVNNNSQDQKSACLTLGFLYQNGYGIRKIRTRAIEFYTYAAEEGDVTAQYNLGLIYHQIASTERIYRDTLKWNSQAFKWTSPAAIAENCNAQNLLGYLYLNGFGKDQDYTKAIQWYKKAAENRCVDAMVALATIYRKGLIVDRDESTAIKYYEMAITEGNTVAQNALELLRDLKTPAYPDEDLSKRFSKKGLCSRLRADALKLVGSNNWSKLEKLITKALRKDPGSMLEIGQNYFTGKDFDQDKDIGFRWMLKGAKGGSIEAQRTVAEMYKNDDFVEQNYHSASVWCRRAAKKGHTDSRYKLGMMYHQGIGVREDHLEASKWYTFATEKDDGNSQCQLGILRLNGQGLSQNLDEAIGWFLKSATQHNAEAFYQMANVYEYGTGVTQNTERARFLYVKAAKLGSIDAQLKVAKYHSNLSVPDDDSIKTAIQYYLTAANSGNSEAEYELAILYLDGRGVEQNFMTAYSHFKQSQELKYGPAENIFHVPIDYMNNNDIDYEKLMIMFALVCRQETGSLEYNLGHHYNKDVIFAYNEEMLTCLKDTPSAKKWLEIAANKGDARAQNELGALFEADKESESSIRKSIYWYEEARKNGNLDAAFTLACFYLEGKNVAQNLEKAFRLLYEISNLGHKEASNILHLSNTPYVNDNYSKVMKMLEGAAESGYASIQYWLGLFKLNNGSSNELQDAVRYLTMVSDGGHIGATYQLGVLFDEGTKVEQDYTKSIDYYQIAASKGDEHALFRLAQFYHFGKGCTQDYTKAYQLYVDAVQEGSSLAQIAITVTERSTWDDKKATLVDLPDEPLFNHDSCLSMWEYLAENENVDLQYKLGTLYENMDGASNLVKAVQWYEKAVKLHHKDAMFHLGRFYQSGSAVNQNSEKANDLFEKSGEAENNNALYQLGVFHANKNHADSDMQKAFDYFERAANMGNNQAQYKLGEIYENGDLSSNDILQAIEWYTKSASQSNDDAQHHLDALELDPDYSPYHVKKHKLLLKLIERYGDIKFVDKVFLGSVYYRFGLLHYYGHGTKMDYIIALDNFNKAHSYHQTDATKFLSTIKYERIVNSSKASYLKKLEMFEESFTDLSPEEKYELGLIYYKGVSCSTESDKLENSVIVKVDQEKAFKYFQMMSKNFLKEVNVNQQYKSSSYFLGMMYYFDTVSSKTNVKTEVYFKRSFDWGDNTAERIMKSMHDDNIDKKEIHKIMFEWHMKNSTSECLKIGYNIGHMYYEGLGVEQNYKKALIYFNTAATKGFSDAQYKLGSLHQLGHGTNKDHEKAIEWYKKADSKNNPKAKCSLGAMYENGEGLERDYHEAFKYYQDSADQGYDDAQYKLGNFYYHGYDVEIDHKKSIEWFTRAANQNHTLANYSLAKMYENGEGVEQSNSNAFEHFNIAAQNGHDPAQLKLGHLYRFGTGRASDYEEAFKWYKKSASQNHIAAIYELGNMYYYGQGTERNYNNAFTCYRASADKGYAHSQFKLGFIYHQGIGKKVDYKKAIEWYFEAAKQDHIIANYNLGIIYEGDKETENNFEIALEHYTVAADHDYEGAQFKLGYFNYHECGTKIDYEIALEWFTKSADQNNTVANYIIGMCYDTGFGFPQDYGVAAKYYRVAANEDYPDAQFKLGYYYHQGYGVDLDYSKAAEWYEKASNQGHAIAKYNLKIMHLGNDGAEENLVPETQSNSSTIDQEEGYAGDQLERILHRRGIAVDQNNMEANDILKAKDDDGRNATRDYKIIYEKYKSVADYFHSKAFGFKMVYEKEIESFTKKQNTRQYGIDFNLGDAFENAYKVKEQNENDFDHCKAEAEKGLSDAQFKLGYYYQHGVGVKKNCKKSVEWYKKAIDQGHALASYNMGVIYEYGQGVEKHHANAFKYYNIAASQGLPSAQFKLGYFCLEGRGIGIDYEKSIEWYTKAAYQGHIIAMFNLGNIHWNYHGAEGHIDIALECYRKAADQGYAYAEFQLGNLYHRGYGVESDSIKAREWYTRAIYQNIIEFSYKSVISQSVEENSPAEQLRVVEHYENAANGGHVDSQIKLGLLYYYGNIVKKNINKSIDLLSKAALKNPEAFALLGDLYHCATDISENFSKALDCYLKVPDGRNKSSALRGIGLLYEYGDGVDQSRKKAREYYKMSADLGNKAAFYNLALVYYYDTEGGRDFFEAFKWFNRVIDKWPRDGTAHVSMQSVGISASDGISTKRREHALVSEGIIYGEANYYLGNMYLQGHGVAQNKKIAAIYFEEAARYGHEKSREYVQQSLNK